MPGPEAVERPIELEAFMAELRDLRERAGEPSFRRMAAKSGAVSHATLHLTVTGHRLQPWETVREFVRACDGDETEWHTRWQEVSRALSDAREHAAASSEPEPEPEPEAEAEPEAGASPDVEAGSAAEVQAEAPDHTDTDEALSPGRPWWRSRWLLILVPAAVVAVLAIVAFRITSADGTESADPRAMVYEGDASKFIRDVTYPDGTVVEPDSQFVKIWEIRNTGSVEWRNRYLQRIDLPIGPADCATPERIPINHTFPRQSVQITVTVRTPSKTPADCKVRWKMVDSSGRVLMPGYRPLYFEVRVRG
ncbi:hypothetical protein FHU38_003670 [Saccharomonospora amisosensis]|uniref:Nbr1 FW domain-containing protein n=1 Tax=Saccharomonospora amisosensis TaxID=1128677 RepID=A0A7X5USC0_9PSEU|nr:NBR1-Ig-like domain-containing protein [Saccharomonospora amisosensis]NIJ13326.1 hypothetical protein [Saccharomonospora amisosensis]